jgi:hypothetical protein
MYFGPGMRLFPVTIASGDRSNKEIALKKALTLIGIASAALAIALPAQASYDSWASPHAKVKQAHVGKSATSKLPAKPRSHRVLCICVSGPVTSTPALTEEQIEAQIDQDMIDHGLDPIYNTTPRAGAEGPPADSAGN